MKTVIYHSADYDGIFCREIAKHFLGTEGVQYIGWNFGDAKVPFPNEGDVFVMDLSPECLTHTPQRAASSLIWIDHHKTSIEKWPNQIIGYRIDGVAACRLAWQWFFLQHNGDGWNMPELPEKQVFIDRNVSEPLAVRLAGEYDIWDKRDTRGETLQYGLRLVDQGADFFEALLQDGAVGEKAVEHLLEQGAIAQRYAQKENASIVSQRSFMVEWEGLKFLTMNTIKCNSLSFEAKDTPETGHDALLAFYFTGRCWTVSLYHAKHRTDLDLSEIAKKHGGGGHRGACGFLCDKLPFIQ